MPVVHRQWNFWTLLVLLMLLEACVSPSRNHSDDPLVKAHVIKRSLKKNKDAKKLVKKAPENPKKPAFGIGIEERYGALLKSRLTPEEVLALHNLTPPKSEGSPELSIAGLETATIALALSHSCILLNPKAFSSEGAPTTEESRCSLTDLATAQHLDFASAVASNPYLHNVEAADVILRAIQANADTDARVNQRLLAVLASVGAAWPAIAENVQQLRHEDISLDEIKPEGVTQDGTPISYSAWEFHREEELMAEADELIAQGHFEEVVALLRKVDKSNVFYSNAQEKLVDACNQAAQKLRSQAAQAFQSALPVADKRARLEYLSQAEEHLQKALDLYPEADQAETIRQNLAVIQKNLQELSSSPSG